MAILLARNACAIWVQETFATGRLLLLLSLPENGCTITNNY